MKKLLIIPSWYPSHVSPGSGTFFREQATLVNGIYDVKIFCGLKDVQITRLRKLINTLKFILFSHVSYTALNNYFIDDPKVYSFKYECGINRFNKINYKITKHSYLNFFKTQIYPDWNPDFIHAHDSYIGGIIANAISIKYSIPFVITEHNYLQFNIAKYIKFDFIKAIKSANKFLLVSFYQLRNLLMYEISCKPNVIGNFVNERLFKLCKYNDNKYFNVLTVARVAYHKDFITLSKVIEIIYSVGHPDIQFIIIGSGVTKYFKERFAFNKDILSICHLYDYVPREEMPDFYNKCSVYLSTSIAETFGVAACEALFCGIPVISTNNGGIDEMINNRNGILINIGDHNALADAILKIRNKEVEFNNVEIRNSVINKFGTEAFKNKLMNIYENIIDG